MTMASPQITASTDGFIPEDDLDETTLERLVGLSEMFPERIRSGVSATTDIAVRSIKKIYGWSRACTWIFFSSSIVLFAPVLFEMERHQMEEMSKMQQRQMLLGPNAALNQSPNVANAK